MENDQLLAACQREQGEHGTAAQSEGRRGSTFVPEAWSRRIARERLEQISHLAAPRSSANWKRDRKTGSNAMPSLLTGAQWRPRAPARRFGLTGFTAHAIIETRAATATFCAP